MNFAWETKAQSGRQVGNTTDEESEAEPPHTIRTEVQCKKEREKEETVAANHTQKKPICAPGSASPPPLLSTETTLGYKTEASTLVYPYSTLACSRCNHEKDGETRYEVLRFLDAPAATRIE